MFGDGAFTDSAGNANVAASIPFRVDGGKQLHSVFPANASPSSVDLLNDRKWFDIQFKPASGNTIDPATILDAANEFSLSGAGRGTACASQVSNRSVLKHSAIISTENSRLDR
ncbi:MAG UNVERIFIED_CONTAM: hypothetical protein LVR18_39920 [Planctomycetaceae bacterium]